MARVNIRNRVVGSGIVAIGAVVAMAAIVPAVAWGQGFSLPDGALTPVTQVRVNYRTQDAESNTEIAGQTQQQSASMQEGAGAFVER